ncbi:cystatin-B isoform X1 [Procambarus clarkii]|uniref:cystatin-B isoform X1 n=1 Tax=Procambarus clarkii TaxID=6728 RepID=UPI001E67877F|nr:cystatin-B-like isoform X1 [Procambarus clarkii]
MVAVVAAIGASAPAATQVKMRAGGTSETKAPNDEVQQLLLTVKDQVEEKLGRTLAEFKLLSYKTQVVAGRNYFAKIDIGDGEVIHLRVYEDLQRRVTLHSVQVEKSLHDDISYF